MSWEHISRSAIEADKWYRCWWESVDNIVARKSVPHVVARMISQANKRCVVGYYRYEHPRLSSGRQAPVPFTNYHRLMERVIMYNKSGNMEYLVDLFNFLRWELAWPTHPNAHFTICNREDNRGHIT